jgi:5-methylcytosine-specific restriction endonuclease McrA
VDLETTLKQCEDHLFPAMKMSLRERSIYYHLFRHTRLIGKETALFAIDPLAAVLGVSSDVRNDLRRLHERGCIRIEEKSRNGHLIRVLVPHELPGIVPQPREDIAINIESIDFFSDRVYLDALLARENHACFYCLRSVRPDNCELDHVIARALKTDNSYRNIVISCHDCNTTKQARDPGDFLRALYRNGVLSQSDLEVRLATLSQLQSGRLIPDIG